MRKSNIINHLVKGCFIYSKKWELSSLWGGLKEVSFWGLPGQVIYHHSFAPAVNLWGWEDIAEGGGEYSYLETRRSRPKRRIKASIHRINGVEGRIKRPP